MSRSTRSITPEDLAEIKAVRTTSARDGAITSREFGVADGQGRRKKTALWNEPGADSFGALARGKRIVDAAEVLLADESAATFEELSARARWGNEVPGEPVLLGTKGAQ